MDNGDIKRVAHADSRKPLRHPLRTGRRITTFHSELWWGYQGDAESLMAAALVRREWLQRAKEGRFMIYVDRHLVHVVGAASTGDPRLYLVRVECAQQARDDSDWPPSLPGDSPVAFDGNEYVGTAEDLTRAGILRPRDVPGNPLCPRKWAHWSRRNGTRFGAMKLGDRIVVAVY